MTVISINTLNKEFIVCFDQEEELILSKQELDHFNIMEGTVLSIDVYLYIVNEILIPKAKNKALNYIAYRDRTSKEMKAYLHSKGYNDKIVEQVMDFLLEYNYVNDYRFAKSFIKYKTTSKPFSRREIYYKLTEKGISAETISEALEELDYSEEECCFLMIKKRLKGKELDEKEKNKLYSYLQRKGFCYSTIKKAISLYEN